MSQFSHRDRTKKADPKLELKQKIRHAQLKNDARETFASAHGKRTLRLLMEMCGYQSVSVVGNPQTGDVHDRGTLYNEARRNLYLELRALLTVEILKDVEVIGETPQEIEDL